MDRLAIWYVIMTYDVTPGIMRQIWRVLKSIPCTMGDVDRLWAKEVQPLISNSPMPIATYIFYREVENPITQEKV